MFRYFPVNSKTKAPLVKDWPNYEGKKEGDYGIVLDERIVVVDVDPRNGGDVTEELLQLEGLLPATYMVTTASGGRHYYYQKPPEVKIHKTVSSLGGIDFQSKGQYVVGEGSKIRGVEYKGNGLKISKISDKLLDQIKRQNFDTLSFPKDSTGTTIEELTCLIDFLPKLYYTNYGKWIEVGMCLHYETRGSKEGLDLWDKWSQRSKSDYEIGETSKKWQSFKLTRPRDECVTIGTLIQHALENGYTLSSKGDVLPALDKGIPTKTRDNMIHEIEEWVYVNQQKVFYNATLDLVREVDNMRLYYSTLFTRGDVIRSLMRMEKLEKIDAFDYFPGKPQYYIDNNISYVNRWKPTNVVSKEGDIQPLLDHFEWLLDEDWIHLINWFAWITQYPTRRLRYALLLIGNQGIGKSGVVSKLGEVLFGKTNVNYVRNEVAHEKYTDWYATKQLILVNELMAEGRENFYNKIKDAITDDVLQVREMYAKPYNIRACCNFVFFSNYDVPIILKKDDRRFCVLKSYQTEPKEDAYYVHFFEWIDKNKEAIKYYFEHVDLKDFRSGRPPITLPKQILIEECDQYGTLHDFIDEWVIMKKRAVFTSEELLSYLNTVSHLFTEFVDARRLANMLRQKYSYIRRMRINGERSSFYCAKMAFRSFCRLTNDELRECLEKETEKRL